MYVCIYIYIWSRGSAWPRGRVKGQRFRLRAAIIIKQMMIMLMLITTITSTIMIGIIYIYIYIYTYIHIYIYICIVCIHMMLIIDLGFWGGLWPKARSCVWAVWAVKAPWSEGSPREALPRRNSAASLTVWKVLVRRVGLRGQGGCLQPKHAKATPKDNVGIYIYIYIYDIIQ